MCSRQSSSPDPSIASQPAAPPRRGGPSFAPHVQAGHRSPPLPARLRGQGDAPPPGADAEGAESCPQMPPLVCPLSVRGGTGVPPPRGLAPHSSASPRGSFWLHLRRAGCGRQCTPGLPLGGARGSEGLHGEPRHQVGTAQQPHAAGIDARPRHGMLAAESEDEPMAADPVLLQQARRRPAASDDRHEREGLRPSTDTSTEQARTGRRRRSSKTTSLLTKGLLPEPGAARSPRCRAAQGSDQTRRARGRDPTNARRRSPRPAGLGRGSDRAT